MVSYEFVVLPAGAVASPGDVAAYVFTQQGIPVDTQLQRLVVAGLHVWNARLPAIYRHAKVDIEAAGNIVRVLPADRYDRRWTRSKAVDSSATAVLCFLADLTVGRYLLYDAEENELWA